MTYSGIGRCRPLEVDHVDVGERSGGEPPAIGDAEQVGGVRGEPTHRLLDAPALTLAHPVGEQERRLARIHDLADVGTGIGETEGDQRIVEHRFDSSEILIEERHARHERTIGLEDQLDERSRRDSRRARRRSPRATIAGSQS